MNKIFSITTLKYAIFVLFLYIPTILVFYFAATKPYVPTGEFLYVRLAILLLFAPILIKYVIHLFIAPWYPMVNYLRSKKFLTPSLLSVSVLIPAWNEETGIRATIESVIKTKYPHLQIIVINDGSTDKTDEIVKKFIGTYEKKSAQHKASLCYINIPNGGKARALNTALKVAHGEIIVTIDSDSVMDKNAIKNLVKHYGDPNVASVSGNVVIGNRTKPIGLIQQLEYIYGFYFKRADSILNAVYIVGGAAASYRKNIITKIGGFDENSLTEDIDLSTRIQDHGYYVRYAADAIVYTEGPSDFTGLFQQRLRWKYGRLLTFFKYRHLFFSTHKKHNYYLTFLILPIALFAEVLLFFEALLLGIFYVYTYYTNDYIPLALVILVLTAVICLQIISDPKTRYHWNLIFLAPGAWIIFYIMDLVEYQALMRSIDRLFRKQKLTWQPWARTGVFGSK